MRHLTEEGWADLTWLFFLFWPAIPAGIVAGVMLLCGVIP